ncbi:MAG: hypothetical protein DHS20C16_08570 [Phycisphaerae bacterium]|nr:MAG: hypothetical protein DHS20C16_08570 [Phycisphaerae bacterium]
MSDKKSDIIYQHWTRLIQYESRDLTSLDLNATRALADREVRGNPSLEGMIRAAIQKRRSDIEREIAATRSQAASVDSKTEEIPLPSTPSPAMPPEKVRETVKQLARALSTSLPLGDENTAQATLAKILSLHKQNPGVIPISKIAEYEQSLGKLRTHLQKLRDQVVELTRRTVSASKRGKADELAKSLRRLDAIHIAYPDLLDEARINEIRVAALHATNERHQHRRTTRELLDRERAIASAITKIAVTVSDFRRAAREFPDSAAEYREAEAKYILATQEMRRYDTEWFSGIVLELADLLAEWTIPPPAAADQIDRFLEGINKGLGDIRVEIREINDGQDSDESDERVPPAS